jgi:hypothetical protein
MWCVARVTGTLIGHLIGSDSKIQPQLPPQQLTSPAHDTNGLAIVSTSALLEDQQLDKYAQATAEVAARGLVQHGVGRAAIDERIGMCASGSTCNGLSVCVHTTAVLNLDVRLWYSNRISAG